MSKKVEIYEQFLNEKLRNDLNIVLNERDKIFTEIAEYLQIKNTIENIIQTSPSSNQELVEMKTKVDLGCNFYVNAVVQDPSRIFIAIGYGFFLEMTLDEALKFIEKKTKILNSTADELSEQAAVIKANIRIVMFGLKEIQNIEYQEETPYFDP
jgi:prefoldin alpha subunit